MCLLAVFFRVCDDAPLVIGANREEEYSRGGDPPRIQQSNGLRFAGGHDPVSGGTWFGVNEKGVFVAVTNRGKSNLPSSPRSRGLLVRELLGHRTAEAAAAAGAKELATDRYAGCNVVCADARTATVLQAGDWLRVRTLPPGLHVLTNRDVNDAADPRVYFVLERLYGRRFPAAADALDAVRSICRHAGPDSAICLRGPRSGTVSGSLLALRSPLEEGTYLHAQGPPDVTPYGDMSWLLRQLATPPAHD